MDGLKVIATAIGFALAGTVAQACDVCNVDNSGGTNAGQPVSSTSGYTGGTPEPIKRVGEVRVKIGTAGIGAANSLAHGEGVGETVNRESLTYNDAVQLLQGTVQTSTNLCPEGDCTDKQIQFDLYGETMSGAHDRTVATGRKAKAISSVVVGGEQHMEGMARIKERLNLPD